MEDNEIYTVSRRILFANSDPAGIVFYVEFFRMFNDLFESWISERIGVDFPSEFFEHQRMFPLLHCEVDFKQARRMGDNLDLALVLTALGRSSMSYTIIGSDKSEEILRGTFVSCVGSKESGRSVPIPGEMRRQMENYLAVCEKAGAIA